MLFFISDEKYNRVQTAKVEALIRKPIKELVEGSTPALLADPPLHAGQRRAIDGITRDLRAASWWGEGPVEKLSQPQPPHPSGCEGAWRRVCRSVGARCAQLAGRSRSTASALSEAIGNGQVGGTALARLQAM